MRLELAALDHLPKVARPHAHLVVRVGLQVEGALAALLGREDEREAVGALGALRRDAVAAEDLRGGAEQHILHL